MAPLPSSHQFQKLKLDTSAPHKPAASTFASIPRHEPQQNGSCQTLIDVAAHDYDDGNQHFYIHSGDRRSEKGRQDGHHGHSLSHDRAPISHIANNMDDIEAKFRQRTTSISFDNVVTLDGGSRLSLEETLPRFANAPNSLPDSDADDSDQSYVEIVIDRKARLQHHVGEPRYPLLQATVNELAREPKYTHPDHVASLTSERTISPVIEEVRTPLESNHNNQYMLSPISTSSPIEFPSFFSQRNTATPHRTRSFRSDFDGEGSYKRSSRKSSARTGRSMSSMSPAASFLSRYKSANGPVKPTEPDDEGQGIGYDGEYIIGKQIGFGGFSVVKEVTTLEDGQTAVYAVKIVRKQLSDKSELENEQLQAQFDHEVEIWRWLKHPYILPLLCVYHTEYATFCITRLNKGGTLFDLVRDAHRKKKKGLDAHLVKRYTYQLASAMRYLHNDIMVVHRDIKLENCLVDMTGPKAEQDGGDVLLCDFGMADFMVSDDRVGVEPHSIGSNQNIGPADTSTSIAGSLQYAAPELFNANASVFSPAADVWAFGVVVYTLLTAQLPFNEGLEAKTTMKIQSGDWDAELIRSADAVQQGGAEEAIELVRGCLNMDPERRWTVNDILACSWLEGCEKAYEHVSRPWIAES